MSNKRLRVFLSDSTLSSLKKRAVSEGKSASGIALEWIEAGLENRLEKGGGGEGDVLEGTPAGRPRREIDTDKIRDTVSEAVREVLKAGWDTAFPRKSSAIWFKTRQRLKIS